MSKVSNCRRNRAIYEGVCCTKGPEINTIQALRKSAPASLKQFHEGTYVNVVTEPIAAGRPVVNWL